jgi:ribosomal protein L11 methylase PrmA
MTALIIIFIVFVFFVALWAFSNLIAIVGGSPPVHTPRTLCKEILHHAGVGKKDTLIDLGSGSGNMLVSAVKDYGATAIGYEISPSPYLLSKIKTALMGQKARINYASVFEAKLSDATVVFVYLLPKILKTLETKIKEECKPGTLIISRGFPLAGLKPVRTFMASSVKTKIFLYKIK